jgi:hypothetical protein
LEVDLEKGKWFVKNGFEFFEGTPGVQVFLSKGLSMGHKKRPVW